MEGNFILLLILAIFGASANTLLFKVTLNAFSSPTTNYGFFVSQASTFLYTIQAVVMSLALLWRDPTPLKHSLTLTLTTTQSQSQSNTEISQEPRVPQSTYIYMGLLDAGSATLGAIAGAYCPGELQTILNQLVIPVTLFGSYLLLYTRFKSYQLWGCLCIVVGACVASSDYYFNSQESVDVSVGVVSGEGVSEDESASSSSGGVGGGMSVTVAIVVYFLSVLPSAFSNIYKEQQMKVHNMNEVHTSTFVSFYQLWIGFLFLPLLALPSLGGLTVDQMTSQMSDGFTCFLGTNPNDPDDDCSHSAYILLFYILLNFVYNVLLLVITKRGSAVLLVVSQALSLPLTNIAFTMKPLMGSDVEPLTITDLVGIILVCIGFLAYSGYGFANSFMVAQGPPGQMAYAHFEDQEQVLVSTKIAHTPESLVHFLVGSYLNSGGRDKAVESTNAANSGRHEYERIGEGGVGSDRDTEVSPLLASERALVMLESSVEIMKQHIEELKLQRHREMFSEVSPGSVRSERIQNEIQESFDEDEGLAVELLQQQYRDVVFNVSPRVTTKKERHGHASEKVTSTEASSCFL